MAAAIRCLVALFVCAWRATSAAGKGPLPVSVHEQRFIDSAGRERHFRGVNVVYKDPPWLPHTLHFHANLSFVQDDVDLLASLGVNLIRLGVMWPGVVPKQRGRIDQEYIERVRSIIRMAARAGIYTIVEPHQDEFNPRFCGEGVPDWWTNEFTQVTDFPVPVQATPFGAETPTRTQCLSHSSFSYIWTHDCARAFQTFWEKGAADFGAYWSAVAIAFAAEPAVLGGELFNEPFPGDVFDPARRLRDNKAADLHNLQPFYANVTHAIREAVPKENGSFFIAYEPTWPVATQDIRPDDMLPATSGFSKLPESDAVYAFHYYVPPADKNFSRYFDERVEDARRLGAAPYLSEFNLWASDAASERSLTDTMQALETRRISYTAWQYKSYSGSLPDGTCTGCGNGFFGDDGVLNKWVATAMGRPFAVSVAGRTRATSFDLDSRTFTLEYTCADTGDHPTEIVVPGQWFPVESSDLTVECHWDDNCRKTESMFQGRSVAQDVAISAWRLVRLWHSAEVARERRVVRVTITSSPIIRMI